MSMNTTTPRADRQINVLSSGQRARTEIAIAGQTHKAETVSPERSFSYTSY